MTLPILTIAHVPIAARATWASVLEVAIQRFLNAPTLASLYHLLLLPKVVLRFPDRAGRMDERLSDVVVRRLDHWCKGNFDRLLSEAVKAAQRYTAKVKGTVPVGGARSPSNIDADGMTPRLSESQRKAVLTAASEGAWSKACACLQSSGVHVVTEKLLPTIQGLFPSSDPLCSMDSLPEFATSPAILTQEDVSTCLHNSSGGLLLGCLGCARVMSKRPLKHKQRMPLPCFKQLLF